jgi:osmoprotectant transport system permease protein
MNGLHHLVVWFNDPMNWRGSDGILARLAEHLTLWAWAMVGSVLVGVGGGLALGRSRRRGTLAVNVANIGRAIPSFAVLVLGVIWLGLGNTPVEIALILLAVPPIFTFTFTGIRQVDAATVESARGMGMTEGRILRSVQVPLALPLILSGIRLASATVLATATLAALVGGGGLGRFVVDGFAVRDFAEVGAGVVLVVGLVLVNEMAFAWLTRVAVSPGLRRPAVGRSARGHRFGTARRWRPMRAEVDDSTVSSEI